MEVLRRTSRVANLNVVIATELQESFEPRARMLRTLSFVAVRQEEHEPAQAVPLVFSRDQKLVDDDLCAVREGAEERALRGLEEAPAGFDEGEVHWKDPR